MKRLVALAGMLAMSGAAVAAQGDPKLIEQGKKLYDQHKCATCHTIEGKGGTMTKQYPLDGIATKMSVADLKLWFTSPAEMEAKLPQPPKLKMSSKKYAFSDADVAAFMAYMGTLKDPKAK